MIWCLLAPKEALFDWNGQLWGRGRQNLYATHDHHHHYDCAPFAQLLLCPPFRYITNKCHILVAAARASSTVFAGSSVWDERPQQTLHTQFAHAAVTCASHVIHIVRVRKLFPQILLRLAGIDWIYSEAYPYCKQHAPLKHSNKAATARKTAWRIPLKNYKSPNLKSYKWSQYFNTFSMFSIITTIIITPV